MVCVRSTSVLTLTRRRDRGLQLRQRGLDAVDRLDHVGARLLGDRQHDAAAVGDVASVARAGVAQAATLVFSGPSTATPDVAHADRRAVACRRATMSFHGAALSELVVGVDREGLAGAVDRALGLVRRWPWRSRRACPPGSGPAPRAWPGRPGCARPASAAPQMLTSPTPEMLRDLLGQDVVGVVVDLGQRQRVGLHARAS